MLIRKLRLEQEMRPVEDLAGLLHRISSYELSGASASYQAQLSTHPPMYDRLARLVGTGISGRTSRGIEWTTLELSDSTLARLEDLSKFTDPGYDALIAPVLFSAARVDADLYNNYRNAASILERVLKSGYSVSEALALKASILRHTANTDESNRRALIILREARQVAVKPSPRLLVEEALLYDRIGDVGSAIETLLELREQNLGGTELEWLNAAIEHMRLRIRAKPIE